ncbi:hypothetical protein GQ54DRAFT_114168 [Martensiomyces pterosporus]|nr:hypothetical protein GQ54DRAFT_114168 [Martensiomyces pterosporus]
MLIMLWGRAKREVKTSVFGVTSDVAVCEAKERLRGKAGSAKYDVSLCPDITVNPGNSLKPLVGGWEQQAACECTWLAWRCSSLVAEGSGGSHCSPSPARPTQAQPVFAFRQPHSPSLISRLNAAAGSLFSSSFPLPLTLLVCTLCSPQLCTLEMIASKLPGSMPMRKKNEGKSAVGTTGASNSELKTEATREAA